MKVLVITITLYERSGWGRYSRGVVEHLIQAGVEVTLLCEQKPENLNVEWYPLVPGNSLVSLIRNSLIVRHLSKQVDVVHAFDAWPFGVCGYLGTLGMSKKLFINGVGTYSVAPLYSLWIGWLVRKAYAATTKVFCISKYTRSQIQLGGVSPKNLTVVNLGADKLPLVSKEEQHAYRSEFSIDEDRYPIIVTVGAIKHRKGQLDTLRAIKKLKEKYPHILYIVAGSDSSKGYVQEMQSYVTAEGLHDNYRIVTGLNDKKIAAIYSLSSLVALNSNNDLVAHHFEGFGLVVVEGYQFGKPAVGSRDCGIEDAIQDGKTGLLADQGDAEDIAQKIELILTDIDRFSTNAAAWYTAFDWQKTVAAYINSYKI